MRRTITMSNIHYFTLNLTEDEYITLEDILVDVYSQGHTNVHIGNEIARDLCHKLPSFKHRVSNT